MSVVCYAAGLACGFMALCAYACCVAAGAADRAEEERARGPERAGATPAPTAEEGRPTPPQPRS